MIFSIDFPDYNFTIKEIQTKPCIFCKIRQQWVVITPEEWVRQHLLHYLIDTLQYPKNFIALEYRIEWNSLAKRGDIVVFSKSHQPQFIIECKRQEIALSEVVMQQVAQYNLQLKVPYIGISNGIENIVCKIIAEDTFEYLKGYPKFEDL